MTSVGHDPAGSIRGRVLVGGWFSFAGARATVGDLLARDVVCSWLDIAGRSYDVAVEPAFGDGVDWHAVEPSEYTDVVFVCGPFYRSDLLRRFERCRLIGVNLSMATPLDEWNPFDLLLERDSSETSRPDITFTADVPDAPVVGLTLFPPEEAADDLRGRYVEASAAAARLLERRGAAVVPIDTGLESGSQPPSPSVVTSLMARMDVNVATRLHGLVLSLRAGVPALAIDPVPGGGRILRQARAIGWPVVVPIEELTDAALDAAFELCLSPAGGRQAKASADRAATEVAAVGARFVASMNDPRNLSDARRKRSWLVDRPTSGSEGSTRGRRDPLARLRSRLRRGSGRSADR